jgi:putative flippase GtrA
MNIIVLYLRKKIPPLLLYLCFSIIVTVVDISIVWILHRIFSINIIAANTIGVVSGAILHYLLSIKSVFNFDHGISGFIIYFITFLFGLLLADVIIYIGNSYLFNTLTDNFNFLFSKCFSIVIPFFFLYYLRKLLYGLAKRHRESNSLNR